jgi:1-acyl-sn-glycerol-3-phosphate acyltransferase
MEQSWGCLFTPSDYHTGTLGRCPAPWLRLLPPSTPRFYAGILYTIFHARGIAKKGKYDAAELTASSVFSSRLAEWSGGKLHVTGQEHLYASTGAAVIVGNHMSTLETFLLPGIIGPAKKLGFVVKASLLTHPLFGDVMRSVPHIAVTRDNPRQDLQTVMEKGAEFLKNGISFCIFPQATRGSVFDESKFNTLGVKLARRAGVPVIPLALKTDFWGNGRLFKDVGRIRAKEPIRIAFGPEIPTTLPQAEVHGRVVEFVRGNLQSWGVPCIKGAGAEG